MKATSLIVALIGFMSFSVFASESTQEQTEAAEYAYQCTATDANYGHYWASSTISTDDAAQRAMEDCWRHSDAAGTCQLVDCR